MNLNRWCQTQFPTCVGICLALITVVEVVSSNGSQFKGGREAECSSLLETLSVYRSLDAQVSVVLVAYNEQPQLIQETIVSLLSHTPAWLLHEVLVVDDASESAVELTMLTSDVNARIIRNSEREGLIRSRLIGANESTGSVIVFADSHIHFTQNWLEPLVYRLLQYKTETLLVLSPFINAFTEDGRENEAAEYLRGGFSWDLKFVWEPLTESEKDKINRLGKATNQTWRSMSRPSPAIAGSVIAVLRKPFFRFGAFDAEMDIWGGENIELSMRAWMCGGRVEILPCSQVSHLFRTDHTYDFPNGKLSTITRNFKRAAKVWMEPSEPLQITTSKNPVPPLALFYSALEEALTTPVGTISKRIRLQKRFGCKDFAWYMRTVYPDLLAKASDVPLLDSALIEARRPELVRSLEL